MAFPSIRSTAITDGTTATASPSILLPPTIASNDLLIVAFRNAVAGAITFPAGWVEIVSDDTSDASDDMTVIAWKQATGAEGGTSITLTSTSAKFAACAWAIMGAANPTLRAPEVSTVATGTVTQSDSSAITPTGGSKDYLFGTITGME